MRHVFARHLHGSSCCWIAALSWLAVVELEATKAANFNASAVDQRLRDGGKDFLDDNLRILSREVRKSRSEMRDEFCASHVEMIAEIDQMACQRAKFTKKRGVALSFSFTASGNGVA